MPFENALAMLQRVFPLHEISVFDTVEAAATTSEVGLIQFNGVDVASFALTSVSRVRGIPPVGEIRIGAVGRFCGTIDQIRRHGDPRA